MCFHVHLNQTTLLARFAIFASGPSVNNGVSWTDYGLSQAMSGTLVKAKKYLMFNWRGHDEQHFNRFSSVKKYSDIHLPFKVSLL